ncbi:hypothetical protein [Streptomyces sp. KLOTTS4A1]|uniref:hypothetical protein n=1 Tax=Streptomyces sp. KLOTTS4A1 TaxID=3390996 RepID=UPI0039F4D9A8
MLGTLLGVVVSQGYQKRALVRGEKFARGEQLRQERLQVYSAYAGALMMYRRAQMERWLICNGGEFEETHAALKARAFDLRVEVYEGLFRLRLITEGPEVPEAAQRALDLVSLIPKAEGREDFDARTARAKAAVNALVAVAKEKL